MYRVMELLLTREREVEGDLESGTVTNGEERASCSVSSNDNRGFSGWGQNRIFGFPRSVSSLRSCEVDDGSGDLLLDKNAEGEDGQNCMAFSECKHTEDKQKRKSPRKPSKPPRPPKGPALDAVDRKLVQELAELAMRRRVKIERVKALKKMRASKSSSSSSSLSAMVVTVLFCLIILFKGILSRNIGGMLSPGSPAPAVASTEDLISVQLSRNFPAFDGHSPHFGYPNLVNGQASVSGLRKK